MKQQAPNPKRMRGRGRKPQQQQHAGQRTFDSNGPDVKIRGSAAQIYEKYQTLARDANSSGDRIGAENYLQHAEHYYRILIANQVANGRNGVANPPMPRPNDGDGGGAEDEGGDRNGQPAYSQQPDEASQSQGN